MVAAVGVPPVGDAQASGVKRSEKSLCANAEWIFIGRVTDLEVYKKPSGYHATRIEMGVEAVAHGAPPPFVDFVVDGGTLNGVTSYSSGAPVLKLEGRYLIIASVRQVTVGGEGKGKATEMSYADSRRGANAGYRIELLEWQRIGGNAPLPSEEEMRSVWYEHCANLLDLPSSQGAGLAPQPTAKYIEFIPQRLLDWCEHY